DNARLHGFRECKVLRQLPSYLLAGVTRTNLCARLPCTSAKYTVPSTATAMLCTQFRSPGFSLPFSPLGTTQSCFRRPSVSSRMKSWSFGGVAIVCCVAGTCDHSVGELPQM